MKILEEKCKKCTDCLPYCPVGAIVVRDKKITIDQDSCVECGVCLRSEVCREGAFMREELPWPRVLRAEFSDPTIPHKKTDIGGRGTAEMKTNDVSGRIKRGEVGVAIELGRPGVGTRFADVEKFTREVARLKIPLEEANPVSALVQDRGKGVFPPEILGEKVLSAIVEFKVPFNRVEEILELLRQVSARLDTVASVSLIGRSDPNGRVPLEQLLVQKGVRFYPNGKVNIGLGRPLAEP
ncbi:MAG: 4Fe-4S ferredoxin [Deltaproteobacteria bacterium]|jgi:NAD-dependent dihydropyrimidine dehydrogenase PreA subunit|nr:4Fe-4S ferredoxin [Deltaproteobacteria bacterium]